MWRHIHAGLVWSVLPVAMGGLGETPDCKKRGGMYSEHERCAAAPHKTY